MNLSTTLAALILSAPFAANAEVQATGASGAAMPAAGRTPTTKPTPSDNLKAFQHDIALSLVRFESVKTEGEAKAKKKAGALSVAAEIERLVGVLTAKDSTPAQVAIAGAGLPKAIELLTDHFKKSPTGGAGESPTAALVTEVQATTKGLDACSDPTKRSECRASLDKVFVLARQVAQLELDEMKLQLPCSRAAREAQADPLDQDSGRFSELNDIRAYLSEIKTVLEAQGDTPECDPSPGLPSDDTEKKRLLRLANSALGVVGMRPRVVALLQPALVFDKDQKAVSSNALIRFESAASSHYMKGLGSVGFRFHGGFGLTPAIVTTSTEPKADALTRTETVVTSVGPDGKPATTTTVTQSGQLVYRCFPITSCNAEGAAAPKFSTVLQNALTGYVGTSLGLGLGRGGRVGELAGFARVGVNHVKADGVLNESNKTLSVVQLDEPMKSGAFWEKGLRLSIFKNEETEPSTMGVLRPLVGVEVGRRRDRRLGSLRPMGAIATRQEEERWFARLTLTRLPVFSDDGSVFDLTLVLDQEWARYSGSRIRPVSRIMVQGNLDFLKAVQGGK
jgi:hypothetical protein